MRLAPLPSAPAGPRLPPPSPQQEAGGLKPSRAGVRGGAGGQRRRLALPGRAPPHPAAAPLAGGRAGGAARGRGGVRRGLAAAGGWRREGGERLCHPVFGGPGYAAGWERAKQIRRGVGGSELPSVAWASPLRWWPLGRRVSPPSVTPTGEGGRSAVVRAWDSRARVDQYPSCVPRF